MGVNKMYTITLSQDDFKEEAHWIALCDSLGVPNTVKEMILHISDIQHIETH